MMRDQVEKTIEVIRPALQADGGDIVLHDVDEEHGRRHGRAHRCVRRLPGVDADAEGRHRADHARPGRRRHRGRQRRRRRRSPGVTPRSASELFDAAVERRPHRHRPPAVARSSAAATAPARSAGSPRPRTGHAYTVGLTGAPGSGKSTLTSADRRHLRSLGEEVAVLAVDPSSPFTGGAILGDRVRMQDHATDLGVFIRSMATRGHLGGLALATPEAIRLLDAVGHRWILVETVGVGQVEVEVAGKADTTVVVVNPGWGDSVQANKAGLMEVADVFVINKADRPGVHETRRDLQQMLELSAETRHVVGLEGADRDDDRPDGDGVPELWEVVSRPPRPRRRVAASWSGGGASASARSCATSSPAASSSGPARSAPANAGTP